MKTIPPIVVPSAVEGFAVFFLSVTTLGCPILAQRGWETITALSSIAGPALKRFALSQVRPIPGRTLEFTLRTRCPPWKLRSGSHRQAVAEQLLELH
jgi:hypothetical protein